VYIILHTHSFNVCDDRLVSFGRCLSVSIVLCVTSFIYRSTRRYTRDSGVMLCSPIVYHLQNTSEHYPMINGKSGDHSLILTRWDILTIYSRTFVRSCAKECQSTRHTVNSSQYNR